MRILAAQCNFTVADLVGNSQKIINAIQQAKKLSCDLILFSELALTGYPPQDFLLLPDFVSATERKLQDIAELVIGITAVVGTIRQNPHKLEKSLYNSAAIIADGQILGFQDKCLLPNYDVFDERRYFEPAHEIKKWPLGNKSFTVSICEDIWQHSGKLKFTHYAKDPILDAKKLNADFHLNLSASPYHLGKFPDRQQVASNAAITLNCPLILCNQVGGNDSLIFDGHSLYIGKHGELLGLAKGFEEDHLLIDLSKPASPIDYNPDALKDLHDALVLGLKDYFTKSGFKKACLGISGGIDSALVACLAKEALGADNVLGVCMPSRYTSPESIRDASLLAKNLNIHYRHIPIESPFNAYLETLQPHFENLPPDTTEENLQARIRGMILMALSNKLGYIVLSTGNKSELAMGYSTLYGDMVGGLGVISDLTKNQVYALSNWINRNSEIIPLNTIERPPSAELKPNQKDSDSLPDYEIVDTVLKEYIEDSLPPEDIAQKHGYPKDLVHSLIKKIHANEYKRRQSPPGLRVSEKAFSVGRHFPIVQKWT